MKDEENRDIEKMFKTGLGDLEAPVPEAAWENIQARLEKKKRKGIIWWRYGAAAGLAVFLGYQFFANFSSENTSSTYTARQESTVIEQKDSSEKSLSLVQPGVPAAEKQSPVQQAIENEKPSGQLANEKEIVPHVKTTEDLAVSPPDSKPKPDVIPTDLNPEKEEIVEELLDTEKRKDIPAQEKTVAPVENNKPNQATNIPYKPDNNPATWLLAANIGSGSSVGGTGSTASGNENILSVRTVGTDTRSPDEFSDPLVNDYETIDFMPPLIFGMSVSRVLSRRWNLDAGLSYSQLSSKTTAANSPSQTNVIRYLGFPVTARYDFGNRRKIGLFLAGSIVPEVSLGGSQTTEGSEVTSSIARSGWQHSVALGAGVDYKINKIFTLYAQPSYSYYFKQDLNSYNFWSQRRWWPSLRAGLRLSLYQR